MDIDHVFVVFASPNGRDLWKAIERENIPDWLKEQAIIDRLLKGEQVVNIEEKAPMYYKTVEIDTPRQAGQHKAQYHEHSASMGMSPGGILLPH